MLRNLNTKTLCIFLTKDYKTVKNIFHPKILVIRGNELIKKV